MPNNTQYTINELKQLDTILGSLKQQARDTSVSMQGLAPGAGLDSLVQKLVAMQDTMAQIIKLQGQMGVGSYSPTQGASLSGGSSTSGGGSKFVYPAGSVRNANAGIPAPDEEQQIKSANATRQNTAAKVEQAKAVAGLTDAQKATIASLDQYTKAMQYASEVDKKFTASTLQRVSQGGVGGRSVLDFQYVEQATGVVHNLQLAVDGAGNVIPQVQRKFRDFAQSVVRDVGELAKWTIAIGLIYGPLQKLQEVTTLMIDNEVKLAQAQIVVNNSAVSTAQIFNAIADSSNKAGESINDTMHAFTDSYRAVAAASDNVTRFGNAVGLMNTSLTLAKLSGMAVADSIDNLSAAVMQTTQNFGDASHMLDSWVQVSRVANVDLQTLVTGVATLGDASEAAGLSTDQLNGIIAVLAQTSNLSSQEVANAARALVAGFQSQQAQTALEKVGIATKNTNGELRNFLDIINQISQESASGVISPTQLSALTLALGGGTRRQAIYTAFIQNAGKVGAITNQSANAEPGTAENALATQTATAQTSIARLDNSLQKLAETLGTSGGFLDLFKDVTNTTTMFVDGLNELSDAAGKVTPVLMTMGVAAAYMFGKTPATATNMINGVAGGINGLFGITSPSAMDIRLAQATGNAIPSTVTNGPGNTIMNLLTGSGMGSRLLQGGLISALPAVMNLTSGDKYGGVKAGADIAGGFIGTLLGGPGVGAIGAAIAEAFVNKAVTQSSNPANFVTNAGVTSFRSPDSTTPSGIATAQDTLYANAAGSGGSALIGNFLSTTRAALINKSLASINQSIQTGNVSGALSSYNGLTPAIRSILSSAGITPDSIRSAAASGNIFNPLTAERVAYITSNGGAQTSYDKAVQQYVNAGGTATGVNSTFTNMVNALQTPTSNSLINSIVGEQLSSLQQQRLSGKINASTYTTESGAATGALPTTYNFMASFGDQFKSANKDIKSTADEYKAFVDLITYGSPEAIQQLSELASTIADLTNKPNKSPQEVQQLQLYQQQAAALANQTLTQAYISKANIPPIVGDINTPMTKGEYSYVYGQAQKQQQAYYNQYGISGDTYEQLTQSFADFAQAITDSGKEFYQTVTGVDQKFYESALKAAEDQGKVISQQTTKAGFQQIAAPSSMMGAIQSLADKYALTLQQHGYTTNVQPVVAQFSDEQFGTLHVDNIALKLALDKLIDINQKQLDGMYNIPEGATFWVPLTAAYYRSTPGLTDTTGTGAGGVSAAPTTTQKTQDIVTGQLLAQNQVQKQEQLEQEMAKIKAMPNAVTGQANALGQSTTDKSMQNTLQKNNGYIDPGTIRYPAGAGKSSSDVNTAPVTRLQLNLNYTTSLLVDGRVLASIVKNYLADDLTRAQTGYGSSTTKTYIV